jgi:hypothetical protein
LARHTSINSVPGAFFPLRQSNQRVNVVDYLYLESRLQKRGWLPAFSYTPLYLDTRIQILVCFL